MDVDMRCFLEQLYNQVYWNDDGENIDEEYLRGTPWVALELADSRKDWANFLRIIVRFKHCQYRDKQLLVEHLDNTKSIFNYNYLRLSEKKQKIIFGRGEEE